MKLSDFDYNLPKELIAQYPLKQREEARLLVVERKSGMLRHRIFKDIADFFSAGDCLVLNDTKVIPARIFGKRKSGGRVEVLLVARKQEGVFTALLKPGRLKIGEEIIFSQGIRGRISGRQEIIFSTDNLDKIYALGVMPLPPYIKRQAEKLDNEYYQTVYAKKEGAIAAPTAGLHFTPVLLKAIKNRGVEIAEITLHVGLGTFKPVKEDDITKHVMEPEYFEISPSAREKIQSAKRIIAVGTTSLRALETYAAGRKAGYTDLFIYPGYQFKMTRALLTNFHLPKTTLFMLVSAFAGEKLAKKAYQEAIAKKYRFYSYGDAMLIL